MRNKITDYPGGSEWRKWNLHVHTPYSHSWTGSPNTEETFKKIIREINNSDMAVFAITDYWTFDGYQRLMSVNDSLDVNEKIKKVIFPGIELRFDILTDAGERKRVNFQAILSNAGSQTEINHRIEQFYSKLRLSNGDLTISETSFVEIAKDYPDNVLQSLVGKTRVDCNDEDFKLAGKKSCFIAYQCIDGILREESAKDNVFIIAPWDKYSGIARIDPTLRDDVKKQLTSMSDAIESTNAETIGLFLLDKTVLEGKSWSNSWTQFLKGVPKPVICGTDGKCLEEISKFPDEKACWIKGDPTFEGLKQIKYEPKDRVRIGPDKPGSKKPYRVIEKVRFSDNSGRDWFESTYYPINSNLTVIIGGKSTGKSLLLYHIARTIDEEEVEGRMVILKSLPDYSTLIEDGNFDFEVVWKDGSKSLLRTEDEAKRKILYIPQNYLSMLSEKTFESQTALNNFILKIILQDPEVKASRDEKERLISQTSFSTKEQIDVLFSLEAEMNKKKQAIESLGDIEGIKKYIKTLRQSIEVIKKQSGLTQTDSKKIKKLTNEKEIIEKQLITLNQDKETVKYFYEELNQKIEEIKLLIQKSSDYLINSQLKAGVEKRERWIITEQLEVSKESKAVIESVEKKEGELNKKISVINIALQPLLKKISLQDKIIELIKQVKDEEDKLSRINLLNQGFNTDKKKYTEIASRITKSGEKTYSLYEQLQTELKKGESQLEDIALNVGIIFDEKSFNENFVESCVNRHDLKRVLSVRGDEEFFYKFEPDHFQKIATIVEKIMTGEIQTIKNRGKKEAIVKLFENYFSMKFSVTYKGDQLDRMSPGKRALVLLKLLIYLSQEEYPILIDQPESDLDNRSVYIELVKFIKNKKKKRQIIIVTHNPNLVVAADSEEVIVANQRGQDPTKENKQRQFEYVSGSLENTLEEDLQEQAILYRKGIREHVCEILEGGTEAFREREMKYNLSKK